eukprot:COSAG02_NODE_73_length_41919_cov_6.571066_28_plen_167_part_00
MLQREAELRGHPAIQRALDFIEINSQGRFHADDKNNWTIDDEEYEAVVRRIARMKSGELKAQLRQRGMNPKGSTTTLRSDQPVYPQHSKSLVVAGEYGMMTSCWAQVATAERGSNTFRLWRGCCTNEESVRSACAWRYIPASRHARSQEGESLCYLVPSLILCFCK